MLTVFVYEYCCALGIGRDPSDPTHSLYREGRAMRDAVVEDFRRVSSVNQVLTLDEAGPDCEWPWLERFLKAADVSLLIAPESDHCLWNRVGAAEEAHQFTLNATQEAVGLCGWKDELAEHWRHAGVPTPRTWRLEDWPGVDLPGVVKVHDGAGSGEMYVIPTPLDVCNLRRGAITRGHPQAGYIVQDFIPGRPASVTFLVGPSQTVPLLPTFQLLSSDGRLRYEGGELPIRPDLAARAVALGRRAIDCVPGLLGYVGVDLILGDADDGSRDYAIEINPRLTTSYVGLRKLADFNPAEAMLKVATGQPAGELRWKPGRVRFRPDVECVHEPDAAWFR